MEAIMQAGMAVRANDMIVTECAANGTLQINEFMPAIAWALLDSIGTLDAAAAAFSSHVAEIQGDAGRCAAFLDESPALITAFLPRIGYDQAGKLVREYTIARQDAGLSLRGFLAGKFGKELVDEILAPQNLVRPGMDANSKEDRG
jgi:aspartate ammonia-lyase